MSTKAVEKVEAGNVPELAPTPATTIGFDDITPPTLYIAQRTSTAVDTKLVSYGDLFIATGSDDPEPQVMWEYGSLEPGVLFYPMAMYKTWTHSDGNNLSSWPWGDGTPPAEAEALAEQTGDRLFRTYNYVVLVPDYDTEMPVNLRLNSKSQRPAANKVNMVTTRSGRPMLTHAFRITTDKKEKGSNKWAVPVVVEAEPAKPHVEQATALFQLLIPGLQAREARDAAAVAVPSI